MRKRHDHHRRSACRAPANLLADTPAALRDFWDVDFATYQAMLLAFAMLTHQRLGTQPRGRALDDNLVRMVLDLALPHMPSFRMQESPEDAWELRGLFHAMAKTDYFDSSDGEGSSEDELGNEDDTDEL